MTDTPESTVRYTSFRIALASGILGATGATLGWIGWLAARVFNAELAVTVGVGAVLGVMVHWLRGYIRVARAEHAGRKTGHGEEGGDHRPRRRVALFWAGGFAFLGLVSEHLVAHMAAEFLRPLLASLASLLPASAIIGWRMSRGRPAEDNILVVAWDGMITGGLVTLVTGFIWYFGFGEVPWLSLLAWWGMFGIGARLVTPVERNAVRPLEPALAVVIVFALTFLLNLLPSNPDSYRRLGAAGGLPVLLRTMAGEIQASPTLPAIFWVEAETRYQESHPAHGDSAAAVATTPARRPVPDLARATDYLTGKTDQLGGEKPPGALAASFRSWLVMLLVALGIGAAPVVEQALRPIDYPNSETYRRDLTLTGVVVVMLLIAMRMNQVIALLRAVLPWLWK